MTSFHGIRVSNYYLIVFPYCCFNYRSRFLSLCFLWAVKHKRINEKQKTKTKKKKKHTTFIYYWKIKRVLTDCQHICL